MTSTSYPSREHANADKAARRRALKALDDIIEDAQTLKRRIEHGYEPHGEDAQRIADKAVAVAVNFAFLEQLRDVREWHAADQAADGLEIYQERIAALRLRDAADQAVTVTPAEGDGGHG